MFKNTLHLTRKYVKILDIKVDSTSNESVLAKIHQKLIPEANLDNFTDKFYITTPNPEIILAAQENEDLKEILNNSYISVPDGIGLKIFGSVSLNVIPGRKLMLELCRLAASEGYRVFLLGGTQVSNKKAQVELKRRYKNLKIEGTEGAVYDDKANPVSKVALKAHFDTVEKLNNFRPHLIFVALGCPKQEHWITKYLPLINAQGAMTVGGAFDYISGEASVPPALFETLKLEWLWRLFNQPRRLARIYRATIVFPIRALLSPFRVINK